MSSRPYGEFTIENRVNPENLLSLRNSWTRLSEGLNARRREQDEFERNLVGRIELLRRTLADVGVAGSGPEWDGLLRAVIERILSSQERLRTQDRKARSIVEAVVRDAEKLAHRLQEAGSYSGLSSDYSRRKPLTEHMNVCAEMFYIMTTEDALSFLSVIQTSAIRALNSGRQTRGKGRPSKLPYYAYIRELHSLYLSASSRKGYYEKDGTAYGPFVDLVVAAQGVLPENMRLTQRSTIASRVVTAFKVKNQRKAAISP